MSCQQAATCLASFQQSLDVCHMSDRVLPRHDNDTGCCHYSDKRVVVCTIRDSHLSVAIDTPLPNHCHATAKPHMEAQIRFKIIRERIQLELQKPPGERVAICYNVGPMKQFEKDPDNKWPWELTQRQLASVEELAQRNFPKLWAPPAGRRKPIATVLYLCTGGAPVDTVCRYVVSPILIYCISRVGLPTSY